jgi:hypothetical protein
MCSTMKPRFAASDDVAEPARVAFTDASRVAALTAMTARGMSAPKSTSSGLLTRWRRVLAHAENGALRIANLCVTRPHGVVAGQHKCIEVLSRRC